mgnify:CR=1 FL=1
MLKGLLERLGIYKLYEKWLKYQVKNGEMPKHIAIILDGNRRWARKENLSLDLAYSMGGKNVEKVLDWCLELKIPSLTLFGLSTENLGRRPEELKPVLKTIKEELEKALSDERIYKNRVKVSILGNKKLLPSDIREVAEELEERTKAHDRFHLNLAIAYGGRNEIVNAVKRIGKEVEEGRLKPEEINEEIFEKYLYTAHLPHPEPDIIIRTSGEERISNFLLWQSAYSELVFLDVYWPEFRKIDLLRAIRTYQRRKRRFGT